MASHGVRTIPATLRGLRRDLWFGPPHACPDCGVAVQYVERRGVRRLEDLAAGTRHSCPRPAVDLGDIIECWDCGRAVVRHGGLDGCLCESDGSPHQCRAAVAPVAERRAHQPRVKGTVVV